jgi:hypothetical protein
MTESKRESQTPNKWFELLMGVEEAKWNKKTMTEEVATLAGDFCTISIKELEDLVFDTAKKAQPKDLFLVLRTNNNESELDTSAVQSRAAKGATFQVASNFNCHEMASEHGTLTSGNYLSNLMTDTTQGPSAAGGAGAGSILRFVKHNQTAIDLVDCAGIKTNANGKLSARGLVPLDAKAAKEIRVGWQRNTAALYDRSNGGCVRLPKPAFIHQVFCSTAIVQNVQKMIVKERAAVRQLLDAAYRATYLCAIATQSPQLVLTLIGGGSFCNPPSEVMAALVTAHTELSPYLPKDCVVSLPLYERKPDAWISALEDARRGKDAKWSVRNMAQSSSAPDADCIIC